MLDKKLLDRFFKANHVKDVNVPSAAAMAQFQIRLLLAPDANEQIEGFMNDLVFKEQPHREEDVLKEREEIEGATGDQVLRIMRRCPDPMNQPVLVKRAMAFEDELVPEIIRMLKTSLNDGFIETATRVLSVGGKDIADELIGYFDDIRNPYAQSMILVVLGFKAGESCIPWLMEKYAEMKRRYPDESYCDGALYALEEIESRFTPVGK